MSEEKKYCGVCKRVVTGGKEILIDLVVHPACELHAPKPKRNGKNGEHKF